MVSDGGGGILLSEFHNNGIGGSTNDIDQTYTPDFGGIGIAGDWALCIRDGAGADTGTLNSWALTIDHGGAGSPVTGLAGSGDTYLVTVSATRDGTYNLGITQDSGIEDAANNPLTDRLHGGRPHLHEIYLITGRLGGGGLLQTRLMIKAVLLHINEMAQ